MELKEVIYFLQIHKILDEIKNGVKKSKIKLKDKFYYDPDPTLITKQIEDVTRYRIRKQNLADEIKRVENSNDVNKEKKLAQLEKLDTIGGINFDSVIIADFEEDFKKCCYISNLYRYTSNKSYLYYIKSMV